jgi:IclR family acetate operon transcriptional repressor
VVTEPGKRGGDAEARRIRAVDHAVDVLEALAQAGHPCGVTEVARRTGLSKATAHHVLATLAARRLLMRAPDSPLYQLGWGLYELGSRVAQGVDLTRVARAYLDQLATDTNESVLLGILDEESALYLDRGEPPTGLRMVANAGRRGPLHATASGKVLLAFAAPPELTQALLDRQLPAYTDNTITDPATLRQQLATIREQGFATCWQEREVGLCSVAVPLRDYTTKVIACLTIAGPATRLTSRSLGAHLPPLQRAAQQIEARLGARGGTDHSA